MIKKNIYISTSFSFLIIVLFIIIIILAFSFIIFIANIMPPKMGRAIEKTPSDFGLNYETINIKTEDNLTLKGWFIPNKASDALIIIGHGYPFSKGNVIILAPFLHEKYNVLLFDFRYFGESDGKYTTVGYHEKKDVRAVVNYVKNKDEINKNKIGAIGFSLSAATFLMENEGIAAIVADSPYSDLKEMVEQQYAIFGIFNKPFVWFTNLFAKVFFGIYLKDVSPKNSIAKMEKPVLLIHGNKDSQIPLENSQIIYDVSNKNLTELWIVDGADHGQAYSLKRKEYERRVVEFFDKAFNNF